MVQTASLHRHACVMVGVCQCSQTVLERAGCVWNCLWGPALQRSPGIIRKSRVLYPGPGFLSSATWPLLPKKHYNGLINQSNYNFQNEKPTGFMFEHNELHTITFGHDDTCNDVYNQTADSRWKHIYTYDIHDICRAFAATLSFALVFFLF